MPVSEAPVTAKVDDPEMPVRVAVMLVDPIETPVARPWLPGLLLIVAAEVTDDAQVAWNVTSWVELSEYVPVAPNCRVVLRAIEGPLGDTAIDDNVAAVTVSCAVPIVAPSVAEMVVAPGFTLVATPLEPAVLLMVAAAVLDEVHVTCVVKSWVVWSE